MDENIDIKEIVDSLNIEVKDTLIKMDETVNLLKDGKIIVSYNKMLGVGQKIRTVLQIADLLKRKVNENPKN